MPINQGTYYPKQKLSYKEKSKDNFKWAKDVIDTLISSHSGMNPSSGKGDTIYDKMLRNFNLFNNKLAQEDFEKDCNLLGIEVGQFKDEVQPYNKIPNKIQALLGDLYTRPLSIRPVLINSEGINSKNIERTQILQEVFAERLSGLIEGIQQRFSNPNLPQEEAAKILQEAVDRFVDTEDIEMYSEVSYLSRLETLSSKILNYLTHELELKEKGVDVFKMGLISAYEVVHIGEDGDKANLVPINPLGFFHHKSPDTKYIEDGLYAGYQTYMNVSQVLDEFDLSPEDEKKLMDRYLHSHEDNDYPSKDMKYPDNYTDKYMTNIFNHDHGIYGEVNRSYDVPVTHVEWVSQVKAYIITFIDPDTGEEVKKILDESFEIPNGAKKIQYKENNIKKTKYQYDNFFIEEVWLPQVWEGVRIDYDIYTNIGPKKHQFRSIDDPTQVKLGYHGIIHANTNSEPVSLVDRIKPFQYLYFFLMHKIKQLIAKDRGRITHIDTSMIPESLGLEKTLYYLDQLDIDFFNSLQHAEEPGAYQRGKITTATDRSNMEQVVRYLEVLNYIDEQISDISGVSKPREGQTPTRQAVTNAQQDLRQSALVTEATYFAPHYNMWRRALTSLVNLTMDIWAGQNITKQWVLDDLSIETLNIKPKDLGTSQVGVFFTNLSKEIEAFYALRNYAQALIQNEMASVEDLIAILSSNSIHQLKEYLIKSQRRRQKQQQELIEQQKRAEQEIEQMKLQQERMKQEHEMRLEELRANTEILVAQIRAKASMPNQLDVNKLMLEWKKARDAEDFNEKKLKLEEKKIQASRQKQLKSS